MARQSASGLPRDSTPAKARAARAPGKSNRGPAAGPENRRALVAAAREVFSAEGLSAPLSEIARRAGVGQGSLYRHFPTRTALAAAVFEENVTQLESAAGDETITLDDFFDSVAAQAMASVALIDLMNAHRDDPHVRRLGERYQSVVVALLEREQRAHRIGDHVDAIDVVLASDMLASAIARSDAAARADAAQRVRALLRVAFAPR